LPEWRRARIQAKDMTKTLCRVIFRAAQRLYSPILNQPVNRF